MRANTFLKRVLDLFKLFLTGRLFKELIEVRTIMSAGTQYGYKIIPAELERKMRISVVIPTLNESSFIQNPILSLKAGSYRNYEVIVVDSMSQDDTAEKAKKLGAKVVLSKKRNVGYQTNLGIMSSTGRIIVRTDADAIFPKGTLADIAEAFEREEIGVYHVGRLYYDGNFFLNMLAHVYNRHWRKTWNTSGLLIAVRRSVYERVAFKPLVKHEDFDFGERARDALGYGAIAFNPSRVVFTSSRAIHKQGFIRYLLRQGSYRIEV